MSPDAGKAMLLVLVDPEPTLEEELNAWYDTEHLPERAAIAGFETARRFTSLGDGPRYAALYDLSSLAVLDSAAYRAVSGENFSPWTRRVTTRARPVRMVARQTGAGGAVTMPCTRLLIATFGMRPDDAALADLEAGCAASFPPGSGVLQWRFFSVVDPVPESTLLLAEFSGNHVPRLDTAAFGAAGDRMTMAAGYRPYRG